jgi:hypothetical protein
MVTYLYGAAVQGIQKFIFQSNRLKEIIGGSELVEDICTTVFANLLYNTSLTYAEAKARLQADENAIIFAAGNIKYLFRSQEECARVVRHFPKVVANFAPGITVSQAVVKVENDTVFSSAGNQLEGKLKAQRNFPMRSQTLGLMGILRSRQSGLPVTYAEKGVNRVVFTIPYKGLATKISGGTVANAVCDYATAKVKIDDELIKKHGLKVNADGVVESFGKSAHGAKPHLGKNAIRALLKYISELDGGVFDKIVKGLFDDEIGIFKISNDVGNVTISPNIIKQTDDAVELLCDLRIPAKIDTADVIKALDKVGEKYALVSSKKPHYVDENGALVQGLLSAYNKVTGEDAKPYSCSGATFASVFKSGVAFGPEFENDDGAIHEPNEYIKEETLIKCFNIYKQALKNILC